MHCSRRLIVQTLVFSLSYFHSQVSPPDTLVVKGGVTWARNGRWILPENARLPRNIQGSFTCRKSTTWNKRVYLPSEGRRTEEFFSLKNATSSAGFETANLGTKGQHGTSRPPKSHMHVLLCVTFIFLLNWKVPGWGRRKLLNKELCFRYKIFWNCMFDSGLDNVGFFYVRGDNRRFLRLNTLLFVVL